MRGGRGQASVELLAVLPLLAVAGAIVVQVALATHAWGAAREAARAGARAAQVDAPVRAAARRMLGAGLGREAEVRLVATRDGGREVRVRLPVPMVLPWIPAPHVTAQAEVPA